MFLCGCGRSESRVRSPVICQPRIGRRSRMTRFVVNREEGRRCSSHLLGFQGALSIPDMPAWGFSRLKSSITSPPRWQTRGNHVDFPAEKRRKQREQTKRVTNMDCCLYTLALYNVMYKKILHCSFKPWKWQKLAINRNFIKERILYPLNEFVTS